MPAASREAPPFEELYLPPNFRGLPSTPGWKTNELDDLTDWATSDSANRPVICEYEPDGLWLWTRFRGTVLESTGAWAAVAMALGLGVGAGAHALSAHALSLPLRPRRDNTVRCADDRSHACIILIRC